jgi:hypothetical protein
MNATLHHQHLGADHCDGSQQLGYTTNEEQVVAAKINKAASNTGECINVFPKEQR